MIATRLGERRTAAQCRKHFNRSLRPHIGDEQMVDEVSNVPKEHLGQNIGMQNLNNSTKRTRHDQWIGRQWSIEEVCLQFVL